MSLDSAFDPTKCLKLQDIALWDSHLVRFVAYPTLDQGQRIGYQSMRGVRVDLAGMLGDDGEEIDILKVFVSLGIRCVVSREASNDEVPEEESRADRNDDENDSDVEEIVLYALEATFSVDYEILETMPEEQVSSFANFNSVHNVWPFWRQHVYETLKKASLPVPEVPFFAGRPVKVSDQ